jgi:hypothetical protein
MTNRLFKYLLLSALIILIPCATTIILILVTGYRIEGMKLGAISGLILPHLIFGFIFIQRQLTAKILITILVTAAIYGLLYRSIKQVFGFLADTAGNKFMYTNFDKYGFWDLVLRNLIFGLVAWEAFYHTDKLMKRTATLK